MAHWYMLTFIGADKPGIVANITQTLYDSDCNLGEASMNRLGNSFTIMTMVNTSLDAASLDKKLASACSKLSLRYHIDQVERSQRNHPTPDISITVSGADHAGIVAQVTNALYDAGLDILDLNSDIAGSTEKPIYIFQIDGLATNGIESIKKAIHPFEAKGIDVSVSEIETMLG